MAHLWTMLAPSSSSPEFESTAGVCGCMLSLRTFYSLSQLKQVSERLWDEIRRSFTRHELQKNTAANCSQDICWMHDLIRYNLSANIIFPMWKDHLPSSDAASCSSTWSCHVLSMWHNVAECGNTGETRWYSDGCAEIKSTTMRDTKLQDPELVVEQVDLNGPFSAVATEWSSRCSQHLPAMRCYEMLWVCIVCFELHTSTLCILSHRL